MSVRHFSIYRLSDGIFTGQQIGLPVVANDAQRKHVLDGAILDGLGAKEGRFDHRSQRVDVETGQIVDYQLPAPSSDHEWDAQSKRWKLSAAAAAREQHRADSLGRICALEAAQARPLRELALDPGAAPALARLREIEAQITELRKQL